MIDYKELPKYKGSDTGIFLGTGISIRNITDKQWKVIRRHDTWSLNDWHYHSFVPDFYHVELKSYMDEWNQIFENTHKAKLKQYENVKFIVNRDHCEHILPRLGKMKYIFGYPQEVKMGRKSNLSDSYSSCSATLVIDLMYKMGYKKIIIFGMDLNTTAYFWTDINEYGETHINTNKNKPIDEPHSTIGTALNFVPSFSLTHSIPIYVGYKETALYPTLPYTDILEGL